MAYVTRTHGVRPHAKFQPPAMSGLAVHKGQTEVQNKGNANIYVDSLLVLSPFTNYTIIWLGCIMICIVRIFHVKLMQRCKILDLLSYFKV